MYTMKMSELITLLKDYKRLYGDLGVYVETKGYKRNPIYKRIDSIVCFPKLDYPDQVPTALIIKTSER